MRLLLLCWAVGAFTLGWAMHRVTWFVLGFVFSSGHANQYETKELSSSVGWPAQLVAGETA